MTTFAPPAGQAPHGSTNHHGEVETLWTGHSVTHWFVDTPAVVYHVVTAGDSSNEPVVFMHGFPETWFAWHHQMAALSDRFFCVAFDLKGYGQSAHPTRDEADYDYAYCAGELPGLFDALGLDRFHLVSHDRGAVIADHLCAVPGMNQRIKRHVRMQQSGNRPHSEPRPPHELFLSPEGAEFFATGPLVDMAYCRAGVKDHPIVAIPIADEDAERMDREVKHPGAAEGMSASFKSAGFDRELDDRMNGLFANMTMPTLFLQGSLDPGQQPHEYETVTDEVADGHLQFIEAGHFLHLEAPDAVSAAIGDFLTRDDLTREDGAS